MNVTLTFCVANLPTVMSRRVVMLENRDILKWIHCRLAFTIMLLDVFHVHQCCSCLGFGKCLKSKMSKIDHRISKIDLDIPVSVSCELHKPVLLNL